MSYGWHGGVLYSDPARMELVIVLTRPAGPDHVDVATSIGDPEAINGQRIALADAAADPSEHSLRIPEGQARALLDILSAHYGNAGDIRQLRADYDNERIRVDRLIGALIDRPSVPR